LSTKHKREGDVISEVLATRRQINVCFGSQMAIIKNHVEVVAARFDNFIKTTKH